MSTTTKVQDRSGSSHLDTGMVYLVEPSIRNGYRWTVFVSYLGEASKLMTRDRHDFAPTELGGKAASSYAHVLASLNNVTVTRI